MLLHATGLPAGTLVMGYILYSFFTSYTKLIIFIAIKIKQLKFEDLNVVGCNASRNGAYLFVDGV
jgi:hypothetical protein